MKLATTEGALEFDGVGTAGAGTATVAALRLDDTTKVVPPLQVVAPAATAATRSSRARVAVISAMVAVDIAMVVAGFLAVALAPGLQHPEMLARLDLVLPALGLCPLAFFAAGLYDRRRLADTSSEVRAVVRGVSMAAAAIVIVAALAEVAIPRAWIVLAWIAGFVTVGAGRLVVRKAVHALQARGVLGITTLVVGCNREGRTIARTLARECWVGYRTAGFVDVGSAISDGSVDGLPVIATLDHLEQAVRTSGAGAVIVASTAIGEEALPSLYQRLQALDVEVRVSAGLPQVAASRVTVEPLDGLPMLALRPNRLTTIQAVTKRGFDIVASVIALLAVLPVMATVAAAVRLTSGPGVLFRQVRVGEGGRPFTIYKFRTMVHGAEQHVVNLTDRNEADGLLFKMRHDPRVTPIGRLLRRWALDELPQLWNVLRGEMSLVGPRPPLPTEAARYDEWVRGRLKVKPGLTGLWQVKGQHELSFDDYVRYDLFYVENWSIAVDLYVIARTIPALLFRRSAC